MPTNVLVLNKSWVVTGSGDPEGTHAAPVGSLFLREEGAVGTSFYVKEAGSGSTGWKAQSGDVSGPPTSTHDALALFSGTSGKFLADSAVLLSQVGDVKGPASVGGANSVAAFGDTTGKVLVDAGFAYTNIARINAANTFAQNQTLSKASPTLICIDTAQAANAKRFDLVTSALTFKVSAMTDAGVVQFTPLTLDRSGNVTVQGTMTATGGLAATALNATNLTSGTVPDARLSATIAKTNIANSWTAGQLLPTTSGVIGSNMLFYLRDTTAPVDASAWRTVSYSSGHITFEAMNDAFSVIQLGAFTLYRTGDIATARDVLAARRVVVGGAASASVPALRNTGAQLDVVLGDASNWARVQALNFGSVTTGNTLNDLMVVGATDFRGGVYVSASGLRVVAGGISSDRAAGNSITSGWDIYSNAAIYPGRQDTGWTVQSSWYIAGHGSYGLYTNTGLYASNLWSAGILDVAGNVTVAGSTQVGGLAPGGQALKASITANSGTLNGILVVCNTNTGNTGNFLLFLNSAGAWTGHIQQNGASGTSYITSSDKRLKTDLGVATDVTALRAVVVHDFQWKPDGRVDRGVFAQDTHPVFPRAIAVGNDGTSQPWGTDYSKFVPDLIVGWQQHEARLARLEAR